MTALPKYSILSIHGVNMDFPRDSTANPYDAVLKEDATSLETELERARALLAVHHNGYELQNLSEQWRCDRGVVLAAVRQSGEALRFASGAHVQDSAIVHAAVLTTPSALRFAASEIQGYRDVVIAAVREDPSVIEFANDAAKSDPEVLFNALSVMAPFCTSVVADPGTLVADSRFDTSALVAIMRNKNHWRGPRKTFGPFSFLDEFDADLVERLSIAVEDWATKIAKTEGYDLKGHPRLYRQKRSLYQLWRDGGNLHARTPINEDEHEEWWRQTMVLSCSDIAGWVKSKIDRRNAIMVLHRGDAALLRKSWFGRLVLSYL